MALDKDSLNSVYSLVRDGKNGEWVLGEWVNQSLWSTDGTNRRLCKFKDLVMWKYLTEVREHTSDVMLTRGQRVAVEIKKGVTVWYFVLANIRAADGKFSYVVGV